MRGMISIEFRKIEEGIIPIYENESKEKLVNARELHQALKSKRDFSNWISDRIKKYNFIKDEDFSTILLESTGGRPKREYILKLDIAKEIALIENNEQGRILRRYFIEVEKRYRNIITNENNSDQLIDILQNAINYMKENNLRVDNLELGLKEVKNEIENIKTTMDVKIQNNYCLASDIAEQLKLYSENKVPHSNLIGAIARQLGYKISYKHYYEDKYIAIVKDISKNHYWQVYFKPLAVKEIIEWFNKNKKELYYEIQYIRNTKNGKIGEIKEKGYKLENISYKTI